MLLNEPFLAGESIDWRPLQCAARAGDIDVVEALLRDPRVDPRAGADDPEAARQADLKPFHCTARGRKIIMLDSSYVQGAIDSTTDFWPSWPRPGRAGGLRGPGSHDGSESESPEPCVAMWSAVLAVTVLLVCDSSQYPTPDDLREDMVDKARLQVEIRAAMQNCNRIVARLSEEPAVLRYIVTLPGRGTLGPAAGAALPGRAWARRRHVILARQAAFQVDSDSDS